MKFQSPLEAKEILPSTLLWPEFQSELLHSKTIE